MKILKGTFKSISIGIVFLFLIYKILYMSWYVDTYSHIDARAENEMYQCIDDDRKYKKGYFQAQGKTEDEINKIMLDLEPLYQREMHKMKNSAYVDWDINSIMGLEVGIYYKFDKESLEFFNQIPYIRKSYHPKSYYRTIRIGCAPYGETRLKSKDNWYIPNMTLSKKELVLLENNKTIPKIKYKFLDIYNKKRTKSDNEDWMNSSYKLIERYIEEEK